MFKNEIILAFQPMQKDPLISILNESFKIPGFRTGQRDIIESIINGHDTLAIMPTGGGKSLCYQLPALIREGTAIVVSPLIALMQDQVYALNTKGIPAAFINSSLSFNEITEILFKANQGQYKLIYISPERLESKNFLEALKGFRASFLAIDEAHCISEWGHDFRPAYKNIPKILDYIGRVPIIALTATATPDVQEDIVKVLHFDKPNLFIRGFNRENLRFETVFTSDKFDTITKAINKIKEKGSIIIYCGSRKRVEELSSQLKKNKITNEIYHGGMPDNYRKYLLESFLEGKTKTIICTNAFGMGVDKSDVRLVIHYDIPLTLEAYYQEAGRAGRDGKEAECMLVFSKNDTRLQQHFIDSTYPSQNNILKVYNYIYDTEYNQTFQGLNLTAERIASGSKIATRTVESILNVLERSEIISQSQQSFAGQIRFTADREQILEFYNFTNDKRKSVYEALLRSISGEAYSSYVDIKLSDIAYRNNLKLDVINDAIHYMEFSGICKYITKEETGGIAILQPRYAFDKIPIDFIEMDKRKQNALTKFNLVRKYAETDQCKRDFLLNYFSDFTETENCGKCTSCLNKGKTQQVSIASKDAYIKRIVVNSVHELDSKYGKTMLKDFIKGVNNLKIVMYGLNKLPSFAAGKDFRVNEIQDAIDECILDGIIESTGGRYPILILTKNGKKVFY